MRIQVVDPAQKHQRFVSKNVANVLVRRLLAEVVSKTLIRMKDLSVKAAPAEIQEAPTWSRNGYEHHLEPKLEKFGLLDTEWLRYLNG